MARLAGLLLALTSATQYVVASATQYVDTHTHFDAKDPQGSVRAALQGLAAQNAAALFFLPPPDTFDDPQRVDIEAILPEARKHPGKLFVLGGGGTLNAMIQRSATTGEAGPEVREAFRKRAEELVAEGVVGFGEMTAEHFAGGTPYQSVPPDHPLFLLLSDLSAQHGKPIVLHLEAVPQPMELPKGLPSPPNPPRLRENIAAFERLLAHDARARIVWAHLGTDGTGARTPALCRRLLEAHPNLYMEIKTSGAGRNSVLEGSQVGAEWLVLFRQFPDRFVIGSDQHYPEGAGAPRWQAPVLLLNQLPPDLQRAFAKDNAMKLYGVSP
jgi:predicted TIM-barrel fold metal-dependent hydrolase